MFSEKLYILRKKRGLSQEQLAEQLKVSRQAISKWESGLSLPESEKFIAISEYLDVTLDYLMKDETEPTQTPELQKTKEPPSQNQREMVLGLIVCIAGLAGLVLWGIVSILNPSMSNQ